MLQRSWLRIDLYVFKLKFTITRLRILNLRSNSYDKFVFV